MEIKSAAGDSWPEIPAVDRRDLRKGEMSVTGRWEWERVFRSALALA